MATFKGYLLAFGGVVLPASYMQVDTYKATPYQRTELEAYRDNNNLLHRITSPNHKTQVTFDTTPLTLMEKQQVQNIIAGGMTNTTERKVSMTYWNDEVNCYITADFYMPDVIYPIKDIAGNDVLYGSISYTFIQY